MAKPTPPSKPTSDAPRVSWVRRRLTARGRSLDITKAGWLFIALTLGVGFAAINSSSNLMHALFGAQMAIVVGSGILSESMVQRTTVRRAPAGELFAEIPGPLSIEISNPTERRDIFSVSVEDDDRVASAGHTQPVFSVRIAPGSSAKHKALVTMPRRGRVRLPPAVVATRFPFGLFVKRRDLPESPEVLVYPRVRSVPAAAPAGGTRDEGQATRRRDRAGEFMQLREFREGDEIRRIHWPATARRGGVPVVREDEAHGARRAVLELSKGVAGDETFERAVEDVASRAVALLREGRVAVGLSYDGQEVIPPGQGPDTRRELLQFLALVGAPTPNVAQVPASTAAQAGDSAA